METKYNGQYKQINTLRDLKIMVSKSKYES